MRRITDGELLDLSLGSKIKVIWHNSPHHDKNEEYNGVIFSGKIGWEDGQIDKLRVIAECVYNDWCKAYLLTE